jgi:hypothetical protein
VSVGAQPATQCAGWHAASLAQAATPHTEPATSDSVDEIMTLADEIVSPLLAAVATGIARDVRWSRDCLFWGDHPGEKLPRRIDLTGPARVLAYGPYVHLPPGRWILKATLAFSPTAVGSPFAIELHGNGLLGKCRFRPPAAGVFAASFVADVRSAHVPNEIRIISENGAIDGEIGIDHIQLVAAG